LRKLFITIFSAIFISNALGIDSEIIQKSNSFIQWSDVFETHSSEKNTISSKTKLVYVNPNNAKITFNFENEGIVSNNSSLFLSDISTGIETSTKRPYTAKKPQNYLSKKVLRIVHQDIELWSITINPIRYDEVSHQYSNIQSFQVSINTGIIGNVVQNQKTIFKNLYLNQIEPQINVTLNNNVGLAKGKVKIKISKDGIYRIYFTDLINRDILSGPIDAFDIKIKNKGIEIPIYIEHQNDNLFSNGDYIEFLAKKNYGNSDTRYLDPYTDINVYWLDWGSGENGIRLLEESGLPNDDNPIRPDAFRDVEHIEEDNLFEKLGTLDANLPTNTRDHIFWTAIDAGFSVSIPIELGNAYRSSTNNVMFRIGLQGLTYSEEDVQTHNVFAYLNDQSVGSGTWIQQQPYILETPPGLNISHNIINPLNNILSISAPVSQDPGKYDKSMLNWVEVEYDKEFIAKENKLTFRKSRINPNGLLEFEISNLTNPDISIIKEGVSKIREFVLHSENNSDRISAFFQDDVTNFTPDYWIASGNAIESPEFIRLDTAANLRQSNGDLIFILPSQYSEHIDALVEHKIAMGWNPIVALVDDIYDEFNYGISSPEAIKSFLKYAYSSWDSQPTYAILIGDATNTISSAKLDTLHKDIPPFLMQTVGWGAVESDIWFGQLEGDDLIPEMIVSRIPISTSDELDLIIEKIILYETSEIANTWQNDVLTIAGFEDTFKYQSESLINNQIPDAFEVSRLFIDRDSEGQIHWGNTDSLTHQWNQGKLLVNFLGHGGGAVWADRSLFTGGDVASLTNDEALAFVTSMTCFTGSFSRNQGLGEIVLTENSAGAIGWLGSAGVGWIINDYLMVQPILKSLLKDDITIGEAVFAGKVDYYLNNSAYTEIAISMLHQYNLLGDPTIKLKLPKKDPIFELPYNYISQNDDLALTQIIDVSGVLRYRILDSQERVISQALTNYNGQMSAIFTIPVSSLSLSQGNYVLSVDLVSESNQSITHQSLDFSVDSTLFIHQEFNELVHANDPILFSTEIHSNYDVDSVRCIILSTNETIDLSLQENSMWLANTNWYYTSINPIISYQFKAYASEKILSSPVYNISRIARDNIEIKSMEWGIKGLNTGYLLTTQTSSILPQNIMVKLWNSSDTLELSASITNSLDTLFFPMFKALDGLNTIQITSPLNEETLDDNILTVSIHQNYFSVLQGIGISIDGVSTFELPVFSGQLLASGNQNAWVKIDTLFDFHSKQEMLVYESIGGYNIDQSGDIGLDIKNVSESVLFSNNDILLWQPTIRHNTGNQTITADTKSMTLGYSTDTSPPEISFSVGGQRFFNGDYVDKQAILGWLIEDGSGIPIDTNHVQIYLDNDFLSLDKLSIQAVNIGINTVQHASELTPGKHYLHYRIVDAFGNESTENETELIVSESESIIDYGNFPNPFKSETQFVYELTRHMDDIIIEIFSVSGFKVKEINDMNARVDLSLGAIAYHEVPWDGKDSFGNFVANGVYFYRIIGSYNDEQIESPMGKVVKNR
jgi:hypothetical protein